VSNAFNHPEKVSDELRERILSYARSVNYHGPNATARSLRTGRCGAVGILFNDKLSYAFTDPHDLAFLRGVSTVCENRGLNIVLIPLMGRDGGLKGVMNAMVDGYILNAPYKKHPATQQALAGGLPTVVVDFDAPDKMSVLVNDREAMVEVAEHLLSLGHRRIGIVTFPVHQGGHGLFSLDSKIDADNYVVGQRIRGCRDAMSRHEINLRGILVRETEHSREGGAEAVRHLLEIQPDTTAIICFSDTLAGGALDECRRRGLTVPEQISVTGFDDSIPPGAEPALAALTTVRQDAFEKGRQAALALLSGDKSKRAVIRIPATLVVRNSTAKARVG